MFTEKFTTIIKSLEAIIGVALIKLKLYYDQNVNPLFYYFIFHKLFLIMAPLGPLNS